MNDYLKRALDGLQFLDEIGGPDAADYIEIMERLAETCADRAQACRDSNRAAPFMAAQGFRLEQTGGGCTAYRANIGGAIEDGRYMLITIEDDAQAPEYTFDRAVAGIYAEDDPNVECLEWLAADDLRTLMTNIAKRGLTIKA